MKEKKGNEIEKAVKRVMKTDGEASEDSNLFEKVLRHEFRKMVREAWKMKITHEMVDPFYRTKAVINGMKREFKARFGFLP